jgi:hypothetical protein
VAAPGHLQPLGLDDHLPPFTSYIATCTVRKHPTKVLTQWRQVCVCWQCTAAAPNSALKLHTINAAAAATLVAAHPIPHPTPSPHRTVLLLHFTWSNMHVCRCCWSCCCCTPDSDQDSSRSLLVFACPAAAPLLVKHTHVWRMGGVCPGCYYARCSLPSIHLPSPFCSCKTTLVMYPVTAPHLVKHARVAVPPVPAVTMLAAPL